MADSRTLLVGSIGTTDYAEITYELGERTVRADVSPAALVELCDIDAALIVRTPEAGEENDWRLKEAFSNAGVDFEFVDINLITERADIDKIIQAIVSKIRNDQVDKESIVLDISHSFRSLPIVFLLSVMQLTSLEPGVTLESIYYSRFAGSDEHDTSPIIDLTYLRTMMEWYDAFEMAQQTGTYREISILLQERRDEFFKKDVSNPEREQFSKTVGRFRAAQREIDAGFPLEAGLSSRDTLRSLSELDETEFVGPEGMVLAPLERLLDGFDTRQDVAEKGELVLTEEELQREAEIVAFYLEHERYLVAIECARELMINRFLYDEGLTEEWLDPTNREDVTPAPGEFSTESTHDVDEVQALWDQIREARNMYAHAGFGPDKQPSEKNIESWVTKLCTHIDDEDFWNEQ